MFSTHPKIDNRIAELEKLEQEMIAAGALRDAEPRPVDHCWWCSMDAQRSTGQARGQ